MIARVSRVCSRQLDDDGSGDLDLQELEDGLKLLEDQQRSIEQQRASAAADLAESKFWSKKATGLEHVAEITARAEAVEAELEALTDQSSLEQRVGMLMMTKDIVSLVCVQLGASVPES